MKTTQMTVEGARGEARLCRADGNNLLWQDDETVKCTTCGKQYTPPAK